MSSVSYASYLSSKSDNPEHAVHVQEFRELCTMIVKEELEDFKLHIDSAVNEAVSRAMSNFISNASKAIDVDVKRIVNITCKEMNAQFHSEEVSNFVAETLKVKLEEALRNIDVKMIIK